VITVFPLSDVLYWTYNGSIDKKKITSELTPLLTPDLTPELTPKIASNYVN